MLVDKTSDQLATEITRHLENKLSNPYQTDWDSIVDSHINMVPVDADFIPFNFFGRGD